jgi:outer membrane protein assembly factor BamB
MATKRLPRRNRKTTALLGLVLGMGLCVGALASATPAAAAASIRFSPASGAPGTSVLIIGSGVTFDSSSTVTFGKATAVAQVEDATEISAIVPALPASSVPIAVTTGGSRAAGLKDFQVVPGLVLTPATGPPGSTVRVSGAGFGKSQQITISFDSKTLPAAPTTDSSGSFGPVSITVPAAVVGGSHTISAKAGTTGKPAKAVFTVTPTIAVSPATGPPGSAVKVSGAGFGKSEKVSISFDGTVLKTPVTNTSGSLLPVSIRVPPAVIAGSHTISALGGTTGLQAQAVFTVTPAIAVSPATGPPGSAVQVSGAGFGPSEGVDVYFDTTDLALAQTGATGSFGPVSITVPGPAVPGAHTVSAEGRQTGGFAQAGFTVNTNWTQFRSSAKHRGANAFENVLSPANVSGIDQDWAFTTGGTVASSPAVVNGVVYIGSDDTNLYALNASTGAQLWSFPTGGNVFSPAVANGVVYAVGNGNVYALNAATGAQQWTQTIGADSESPPTVANGTVYVGLGAGVYAFNAATGAQDWTFTTGEVVDGAPAVANGVVYVGSVDGNLYALNASTGAKLWSFSGSEVETAPAVADGVVYAAADNGNIYALNATTGSQLWSFSTGSSVFSSPAVTNGVVYVGSNNGNVYALDAASGTQLWSFATGSSVSSSPAVANGVVYVGSDDDNVYALNAATGARLWSFTTGGAVGSSPTVVNGEVYVGSNDGNLYAFDLAGGQQAPARPRRGSLHPDYRLRVRP